MNTIISLVISTAIITFFVNRLIIKPVKQMVEVTEQIAQGNLNIESSIKSSDELGNLSNSFNEIIHNF